MHKLVVLYPPPADADAFLSYYVERHLPLAEKLPGLRASRHMRPSMLTRGEKVFVIWEGLFDSEAEMFVALKSNVGQRVANDVPNYSPNGATMMHFAIDGERNGGC